MCAISKLPIPRRGTILSSCPAFMLVVMVGMAAAAALDIGYICVVQTQAQAAADAAALAAGTEPDDQCRRRC